VPVHLSATDPNTYQVVGWLCAVGSPQNKTVQVLIPGGTYDDHYWDLPYQPQLYSYVQRSTQAGYAVFTFDRLGTGLSDHPSAVLLTYEASTFAVHDIIQALRSGAVGGWTFNKIVTVGHSFGSAIAAAEAANYHDIDGVVLTGFMHSFNPEGLATVFASFYPAELDPKFAAEPWALGYLTTLPGSRGGAFYNTALADPLVIALDETYKSTDSYTGVAEFGTAFLPSLTQAIQAPVLLAVGEKDLTVCNESLTLSCTSGSAIVAREQPDYSTSVCLEAVVQPGAGHSIALHPNAATTTDFISNWISRRVGNQQPASQPCQ
jgi:pimeloyl-ACP methyl ester carboxylesterase